MKTLYLAIPFHNDISKMETIFREVLQQAILPGYKIMGTNANALGLTDSGVDFDFRIGEDNIVALANLYDDVQIGEDNTVSLADLFDDDKT